MLVDFDNLKEHFDGDTEIIGQLVEILEESYPVSLNGLKEAIKEEDFSNVQLHAHTLKGMIANFFAAELKESAFELEKCGSEKNLKDGFESHLDKLENDIPKMILELKSMNE